MQDTLTKAERTLLSRGRGDFVMEVRQQFQQAMGEELVSAIEMLTERKVIAFMSANHLQPDMGAELFVLQPRSDDDSAPEISGA